MAVTKFTAFGPGASARGQAPFATSARYDLNATARPALVPHSAPSWAEPLRKNGPQQTHAGQTFRATHVNGEPLLQFGKSAPFKVQRDSVSFSFGSHSARDLPGLAKKLIEAKATANLNGRGAEFRATDARLTIGATPVVLRHEMSHQPASLKFGDGPVVRANYDHETGQFSHPDLGKKRFDSLTELAKAGHVKRGKDFGQPRSQKIAAAYARPLAAGETRLRSHGHIAATAEIERLLGVLSSMTPRERTAAYHLAIDSNATEATAQMRYRFNHTGLTSKGELGADGRAFVLSALMPFKNAKGFEEIVPAPSFKHRNQG